MSNEDVIVYCEDAIDKCEDAIRALSEIRAHFVNLGDKYDE